MPNLEGALIKIARASYHIEELRTHARGYVNSKPYEVVESEDSTGNLVYKLKILRAVPREWAGIVGDAVHNMRAALDLLVWQLVECNGGTPTRDTCFPIGKSLAAYEAQACQALTGVHPAAVRMIRRLRPYLGGNTVLAQLHALDIEDKHRVILLVGAACKHLVIKPRMSVPWQESPIDFPGIAIKPADRDFPLTDGAEVFRIGAVARNSDVRSEYQLVFELAFGDVSDVEGLELIATLERMHSHVSRIVNMANRRFFR